MGIAMSTSAMSTSGLAQSATAFGGVAPITPRRHRKNRKSTIATRPLAWNTVALQSHLAPATSSGHGQLTRPPAYTWWLIAAAVVIHASLAWYIATHIGSPTLAPKKEGLSVELVRPKPPEPKVEPPKPPPPKPQLKRPAQVLPPIQQAAPEPSDTPAAVSSEPPVAVAPVLSAQPEPQPEPETAPIGGAGYLNNPPPDYPAAAARQGWQGTVTLRVRVLSTGKVESVEVQRSSGRRILDDEAIRTVKSWLFTPSKRGSTPIDGWATVPIEFTLQS
jgi:protein TonB